VADHQSQPTLAVIGIAERGVIDGVGLRRAALGLLEDHLESTGGASCRLEVTAQADKRRMKGRDIFGKQLARVTLGVDGDEGHLHIGCARTEQRHHLGHHREGCRTEVRALGVAEEQDQHAALEIRKAPALAMVIGKLEILAEIGAGDIDRAEGRLAAQIAGGQRQRADAGGQQPSARGDARAMLHAVHQRR
jgi:hypothetical protein